jgi:hypothetical protein
MWRVAIRCSGEDWALQGVAFKAIAEKYNGNLISSKKMKGDEQRIMEYQIEDVSDAEDFVAEAMTIPGFAAFFESL